MRVTEQTPLGPTDGNRVAHPQKIAAGMGGIHETLATHASSQIAYPIFNIGLGVSPAAVGLALAIPRLWDAFIDPWVGAVSDRTRSRFGRRRPHMAVASVASGLLFAAIWWFPRGMSPDYYFWHFLTTSLLFFTASAFFTVPWQALLVEMTPDYHERTRVQAARSIIATFGALLMPWLYWATQLPVFADAVEGVRYVGIGVGLVLIIAGLLPAIFVRERTDTVEAALHSRRKIPLWQGLRTALSNRPFLIIAALMVLFGPGILMTEGLGLYVNIYHVNGGDAAAAAQIAGVQGTLLYGAKFLWVPIMTAVATRWGKKRTLFLCFSLALVASLCKWFCYTPAYPWLQVVVSLIQSPGMAPAWVLMGSMIADTVDWDEAQTGLQRAGLLLAIAQWMRKTGSTVAFFLSGQILLWSGYEAARGSAQSEATLLWLRILFPVVPTVCIGAAMLLLCLYPISEDTARAVRRQIEARRRAMLSSGV